MYRSEFALVACILPSLLTICASQQDKPPPKPPSSNGPSRLNQPEGQPGTMTGDPPSRGSPPPPPPPPAWLKCVAESSPEGRNSETIAAVLDIWCRNHEAVISCLMKEYSIAGEENPLDFFINLNFDAEMLRSRSKTICANLTKHTEKLTCTESANQTIQQECGRSFSGGVGHIFGLHKERNAPMEILKEIACDVTLQTTFCLRASLADCEVDVQTTLVNYYSLFTNESCVAQPQRPGPPEPEPVIARCARQAVSSVDLDPSQTQPTSVLDFLIIGIKTDCKTYEARYDCYRKELQNITNFRDFWLSLTFDYDNAVASQKEYCAKVEDTVISKLSDQCFQQAQEGLDACEAGFAKEMETIRDQWINDPEFDGLQLQTLACRTSVTRAACLDKAMEPCGQDVSRAMAVSEMGLLPNTCRDLLRQRPDTFPGHGGQVGEGESSKENMVDETNVEKSQKPMMKETPSYGDGKKMTDMRKTGMKDNNGMDEASKSKSDGGHNGCGHLPGITWYILVGLVSAINRLRFV
ncbi:hypothetical protein PoB_000815900 [Plakobranchus ocellatus]|uniref:Secreted protein n=1 Tax=Plakobranchus ocellatus TaxID=259542 RepID=A0AAV3YI40_9GAST|nr:hypothetical protein PoB_000815900 [Plakobranchus ocellatus]